MNEQIGLSHITSKVAVIGCGDWGTNHVRNFHQLGALSHICDTNDKALAEVAKSFEGVCTTNSFDEVLRDSRVQGVVIATPAATHYQLAEKTLIAGKDVLVEKPLALEVSQAQELVDLADNAGRILMVGHILLYHPAVMRLKEIVQQGSLGRIQHIQSNRLSLGKIRSEENILWSFAPHDISMILYLLDEMPNRVYATGFSHLQRNVEDVTISVMEFPSGVSGHIYVSWMNPIKEQRLTVLGDKGMVVFEDSRPDKKLRMFHNSFHWIDRHPVPAKGEEEEIPVEPSEPLRRECEHFLDCMKKRRRPRSDGTEGLRTLKVLQQCYESMKAETQCRAVVVPAVPAKSSEQDYFAHVTAAIDEPCRIGLGTTIWHFSHVMPYAHIGKNCRIGQNVLVGKGVSIGDNCKIQNNVSIYEGVTLEDHVFCGPSMVFTNVYNPRCEIPRMTEMRNTLVKRGATLGANSTIMCGITVGAYAFVGAGTVVLHDVPNYALMVGNPAERKGWMCRCGTQLQGSASLICPSCRDSYRRIGEDCIEPVKVEEPAPRVPLLNLKTQYLSIKPDVDRAIANVLDTQVFIGGPEVDALEKEISAYCGTQYAVGVSSGTDALLVSLMALGIKPGDEVITTPFTFFATVGSILRVGAEPVFADIEPTTFNIDPAQVQKVLTPRTKAIIPVHLFGQCAEMRPILEISEKYGIPIVEDAAQAIGSEYKGKRAGSMGTLGCFSFFPSKNLGALGDGGMIITNHENLAETARIIRNQGAKPKYCHKLLGGNFRLDAIHAAVLRVKLNYLDIWTEKRMQNAAYYTKRLDESGLAGMISTPKVVQDRHIFNQYVIRAGNRDSLRKFLKESGIDTEIYYPKPLHLQECLARNRGYSQGQHPVSEEASNQVLALPVFPELTLDQKDKVVDAIVRFYE